MWRPLVIGVCFGMAACGSAPEIGLTTTVRMDSLLKDEVNNLAVFVLGPRRTDDIVLTCPNLIEQYIRPGDSRVEQLGQANISFADPGSFQTTIKGVKAGPDRIVYIEAYDATSIAVGNGCEEYVQVEAGKTISVEVDVYAFN